MLSQVKITSSLFPEVYADMLREPNSRISRSQWQRLFDGRWTQDDCLGYALADGGRFVGMLGALFSERAIAGKPAPFCNLHTWHVLPEYRSKSLLLLKPLLALKDHTMTDFTSSQAAGAILKKLGFNALDSRVFVLAPAPSLRNRSTSTIQSLEGLEDANVAKLNPADQQIYQDHQGIDCGHAIVDIGDEYCYIVYSRITRHHLSYCLVHYISNRPLFLQHIDCVGRELRRRSRSSYVLVEVRMLEGAAPPLAFRTHANEKLYRPAAVAPHDVDTLYSEVVLFKHSLIPSWRRRLGTIAARHLPAAARRYVGLGIPNFPAY